MVALCESINFKQSGVCDDNVIDEIVRDLTFVRINGVDIGDGFRLKVALFNTALDNLGANVLFGFAGSFSAEFYCRFCECSQTECQTLLEEVPEKMRTKEKIAAELLKLELNPKLELKETKGIRKNCMLNNLDCFHITSNLCVDIMHDFCEGIVPLFLKNFFQHCIDKRMVTKCNIICRVRDYNYGTLSSRNKPSPLKLAAAHLGNNSSQLYCLINHMPFIFRSEREKLGNIWTMMTNLLQCMRIIFSDNISETDLIDFTNHSKQLLSDFIEIFKICLIPKLHNLIHYPNAVRQMGPPKKMWMMPFEAKHKVFTNIAKKTLNFVNITKSMAETHQSYICTKANALGDTIEPSVKKYLITKSHEFHDYSSFFSTLVEIDISQTFVHKFLKFNGVLYRKGLMVMSSNALHEIIFVLRSTDNYFLFCQTYIFTKFDISVNALEIAKLSTEPVNLKLFKIEDLTLKYCIEKTNSNSRSYVIAKNLEIVKPFQCSTNI